MRREGKRSFQNIGKTMKGFTAGLRTAATGVIFAALASCGAADGIIFVQVDPLTKYFPENTAFVEMHEAAAAAGGQHVEYQFAVRCNTELENMTVECSGLVPEGKTSEGTAPIVPTRIGMVGYVGVGEPADNPAHDVLKSSSGLFPDPIVTDRKFNVPANRTDCLWITAAVPRDAAPGKYSGRVRIHGRTGGRKFSLSREISLDVYPVVMETPYLKGTNWCFDSPGCLRLYNGGEDVERYSDLYWKYVGDMAEALKEAYQTTVRLVNFDLIGIERDGDTYSFDFSRFDETVSIYMGKGGLKGIQGSEIGGRAAPAWESPFVLYVPESADGRTIINKYPSDAPEARLFYGQYLPALMSHLKEKGWDKIYTQQLCDEPVDANADSYRKIHDFVKGICPELRTMEACQTTMIDGAIDVWVPQMDTYHNNFDFFRKKREEGAEVWFYTCCYPRGEYPNRFIEQPLLKTRLIYWMMYKYGVQGHLHWGFNCWNDNPWRKTNSPAAGFKLPGGDSWIVYPGYRKFERSIRYEAMRDGIEDYTLLKMLEAKNPAAAQRICDAVILNWWVYSTDPDHFNNIRRQLLEYLSE